MQYYTESEILTSIDDVNECIMESTLDVFNSIIQECDKLSQVVEFTVFDESVIMEGQVWDTATGKGTLDGTFKKILLFIPRLLMGIIKAIGSVFTKDYDKDLEEDKTNATNKLNGVNDPNQLQMAKDNIVTASENNMTFDPKKKSFFLVNGFKHMHHWIQILTGVGPLLRKLKTIADGGSTSYGTLAKELWGVLRGKIPADGEVAGLSANALFELAQDGSRAARGLKGICGEVSMHLEKQMRAMDAAGEDITKKAEMKDLVDSVSATAKIVTKVTFFGKVVHFLGKDIGRGSLFLRKIRSKHAYDEKEDVALMNAKNEKKELKARIKANNRMQAKLQDDQKRLEKKRAKLDKYNAKNAKLEEKLAGKRETTDINRQMNADSSNDYWSTK